MTIFSTFFFLGNIGQGIVFYDILETKKTFVGYKNNNFKKVEKVTVFVQKWLFLQVFFLSNIGQENVFYDILERKNAFLGYNNKKLDKVEKLTSFQRG